MARARCFDHDDAQRRYDAGELISALATEYGVTWNAVYQAVTVSGRQAAIKAAAKYREKTVGQGVCDECGGPMNLLSRQLGSTRCVACAARSRALTVRESELLCITCKQWKTDEDFPFGRGRGSVARRGRHRQCRVCQTIARRSYRHRYRERENAYQREYKRRRKLAIQPSAEDGGKQSKEKGSSA